METFKINDTVYEKANGTQWEISGNAVHPEDELPARWLCRRWENSKLIEREVPENEITNHTPKNTDRFF